MSVELSMLKHFCNSPCSNCLILPICNNKEIYTRLKECNIVQRYLSYKTITVTDTGDIMAPSYVIISERIFTVVHYLMKMKDTKQESTICIIYRDNSKYYIPLEQVLTNHKIITNTKREVMRIEL